MDRTAETAGMVEAENIRKTFGRIQAVRGISFTIGAGEIVGLLGPNGAGKTTSIRMITGFLPPDAGRVRVAGHDTIESSLGARRAIGYLPEAAPLYPEMPVTSYLHFRGRLFGLAGRARRDAVERAVERCWLREVRQRRIGTLSKGYRQRVGLAAALVHEPPVLVLDEPTTGLDPAQVRETRALVRELGARRTLIFSSHVLSEVEAVCDRVIIIARGRLLADGAPRALVAAAGSGACIVQCRATPGGSDAGAAWASIPGASAYSRLEAEESGGWMTWRLEPTGPDTDLREPVARAAAQAGLLVRELRRETPTLEQVFVRIVEQASDAELPGATPPAGARPA